ncbi:MULTISPECIES: SDR family oxidoreductase [Thermomonospora]|uniref:NAD(P)-dependent dehydrogenase (Short-subunit alcohol dehydrogenase family) n=1 Tax=Thermomonospora cellulosilytica TaxID=1411118 RepID=A0A7W3R907_9ACTN|nr:MULTISPECIES: SDR family oxidoreductase [Thermomonospora]MBA9004291.1 NAD(P)-dependent dehydrogenase (short-subunit alcohol dehydrogenase family) [Thermomonospora cellulosilytica]
MNIAIVTGGASGIGRAIATELVARGDTVVVADIDAPGAEKTAAKLNTLGRGRAKAAELDVTDAEAVAALYTGVRDEHGRLDLVFNNAGIAIGGLAEELTLEHWNRAIDINLKGVVHGVHAAYPIMLEQRSGHIVNTASLAGLVPMPMGIPYTATKHAVVGLSLGLRAEAAGTGVKVSVVCPGFVDTPLLKNINPGLPETPMSGDGRAEIRKQAGGFYTPERLARDIMRGVDRDQAMIVAPRIGRAAWRGMRLSPRAAVRAAAFAASRYRREHRSR